VTIDLARRGVRAVLLDIEGTTTPIAFVHEVLFPYARAHVRAFLDAQWHTDAVRDVTRQLIIEHAQDATHADAPPPLSSHGEAGGAESLVRYVEWLMDRDRKSPGLKALQGLIWEEGYRAGELRGAVFPDVAPACLRWQRAGIRLAIYSSGSELAQRRLFESTPDGDLSRFITAYFDTAVGPKRAAASYAHICTRLQSEPSRTLFLSDVVPELEAASVAGLQTALVIRPGNPPQPEGHRYERVHSFEEITA
jgi:enolase-phosphatase E1